MVIDMGDSIFANASSWGAAQLIYLERRQPMLRSCIRVSGSRCIGKGSNHPTNAATIAHTCGMNFGTP